MDSIMFAMIQIGEQVLLLVARHFDRLLRCPPLSSLPLYTVRLFDLDFFQHAEQFLLALHPLSQPKRVIHRPRFGSRANPHVLHDVKAAKPALSLLHDFRVPVQLTALKRAA
jgi:hypothetical protein